MLAMKTMLSGNTCLLIQMPMASLLMVLGHNEVQAGAPASAPSRDLTKPAAAVVAFTSLQSDLKLYPLVVAQPEEHPIEDAN